MIDQNEHVQLSDSLLAQALWEQTKARAAWQAECMLLRRKVAELSQPMAPVLTLVPKGEEDDHGTDPA
jgi:hypothetical protein